MDLTCPKCQGTMRSYERSQITVDQCNDCRGIFLDRGELERLMDAEASYHESAAPDPRAAPAYGSPADEHGRPGYRDDRSRGDGRRDEGYRGDRPRDGQREGYRDEGYRGDAYRGDGYRDDRYKDDRYKDDAYRKDGYRDPRKKRRSFLEELFD